MAAYGVSLPPISLCAHQQTSPSPNQGVAFEPLTTDPYLASQYTGAYSYAPGYGAVTPYVAPQTHVVASPYSAPTPCAPSCPTDLHLHRNHHPPLQHHAHPLGLIPSRGGVSGRRGDADGSYSSAYAYNPDHWWTYDRYGVFRPARRFRELLVRLLS